LRITHSKGFTLVELLVAVVVIGVIATIAIPALVNALDRGRQKRTMADLHTIAMAIQAYSVDNNRYPAATDMSQLALVIEGDYIRKLPRTDGWGHDLLLESAGIDYTIGSTGKDGGVSLALIGSGGPTHAFGDDIIFSNGTFVQWPEGTQD